MSVLLLTSACGGGGDDEAGSFTAFSVAPDKIGFKDGSVSGCALGGSVGTIYVYGGAAPYRIDNTAPAFMTVDRTTVSDRGGSFNITATGYGCLSPGLINVIDKNDRKVDVTVTLGSTSTGS